MNAKEFIQKELSGWGKYERIIFPAEILLIIILSVIIKDNKIALISAICGISYTILAGKGKISCYLFGLMGTLCYAFIAFKNYLFGNVGLYICYYFPMQLVGIFKWRQHLKKETNEIQKIRLSNKERIIYTILGIFFTIICYFVLIKYHDKNPIFDSITTIFSIFGLLLTVKRCIEQWYVWIVVNGLSAIMWLQAYLNGSNCFATVIMWVTYFILAIYFLINWEKDIQQQEMN